MQNNLLIKAMIAGLKLSNSVGNNNHVKIVPYINTNDTISYDVFVETNNFLTFFCASTVIADPE